MNKDPLISVVIPVYGAEKYIEETINSVINQSYSNWELIAVNDGSPDNCEAIIKKIAEKEPRIRYYHKENSGVSDTRNYGIQKAQGEYIAFLDADDTWIPNKLELQLNALEEDPDLYWVFGDVIIADENMDNGKYHRGFDDDILNDILAWKKDVVPGPSSNIMVKKTCFHEGKISFDTNLSSGADQDITIQLAAKYKGKRIPEALWTYRVLPNSMSKSIPVTEHDHLLVFNKAKKAGLFFSKAFERSCFANLYLIIGSCWWKDANNKSKAIKYGLKAFFKKPSSLFNMTRKLRENV